MYSNVDGAQVSFDNVNEGNITNGVLYVTVAVTGTPVRTYRVESPGYIPYTASLAQWPASGEIIKVQAPLVPLPVPTTHAPLPVTVTLGALIGAGGIVLIVENRRRTR